MISRDGKKSRNRYRHFVEEGIEEMLENPLKNVYGGAILGGEAFIRESLERLEDGILQKEEVAHRRELQAVHGSEEVIAAICTYFKISPDDIFKSKGEYRNIAIYLMKKMTSMTNKQIGDCFDNLSYSAVTKAYQRFSRSLRNNEASSQNIAVIVANLS